MTDSKISILGIDDDPEIEAYLAKVLAEEGYEYQHVHTLEKAEQYLKKEIPDIILLDISLGEEYGLDIYDKPENQARLAKTKVLVLSGAKTPQDVQLAVSIGVNDYIIKPVTKEILLEKIKKHIS